MEKQVIMPLLSNISSLHTTPMGINRIRKNLRLADIDVVEHCKNIILNENCHIYREGKNYYYEIDGTRITINANSFTIITAHKL